MSGTLRSLEPSVLRRADGPAMFYPGKINALNGEPETGKTWVALAACAERLAAGETVLLIDFEDDVTSVVNRMTALGVDRASLRERFLYVRPDDGFDDEAKAFVTGLLLDRAPVLVVLDGMAEAMVQSGLNEN